MVEVSILIPLKGNDGETFDDGHHAVFESKLLDLFDGMQLGSSHVEGKWVDEGRVYSDELRIYTVAVKGLIGNGLELMDMIEYAKSHYEQLAIYIKYLTMSEIL